MPLQGGFIPLILSVVMISAEFPALVMTDIIYTHYLNYNKSDKLESLKEILNSIDYKFEK